MNNEKFIKRANILDRIFRIVQGFMTAAIIVMAIFILLTIIFGKEVIASADKLELGAIQIVLEGDMVNYLNGPQLTSSIVITLIANMISAGIIWYGIRIFREILLPMKAGQPFCTGISERIRKLGWVVLLGGLVHQICEMISAVFEVRAYNLGAILASTNISHVEYRYTIDGTFLMVAVIIFLLAYIFRYGEQLQKESDETL